MQQRIRQLRRRCRAAAAARAPSPIQPLESRRLLSVIAIPPQLAAPLSDTAPPVVIHHNPAPITRAGRDTYPLKITFTDNQAIDRSTFSSDDLLIIAPRGKSATVQYMRSRAMEDGRQCTATYRIGATDGRWDIADNGAYVIYLRSGQVGDVGGNMTRRRLVGQLTVRIPSPATVPTAIADAPDLLATGSAPYRFTMTYRDDVGIDLSTIGTGDLRLHGPGFSDVPHLLSATLSRNGRQCTAVYELACPQGSWDQTPLGIYYIAMQRQEVSDTRGHFVNPGSFASFRIRAGG